MPENTTTNSFESNTEQTISNSASVENENEAEKIEKKLKSNMNRKYTQISFYCVITVLIIYFSIRFFDNIGGIFSAVGVGITWFGILFKPLAYGFAISYILFPVTEFLEKKLSKIKYYEKKKKKPHGLAVALTFLIAVAIIVALLSLIISTFTSSIQMVSTNSFDEFISSTVTTINNFYTSLIAALAKLNISSDQINSAIQSVGKSVANYFLDIGNNLQGGISNVTGFFTTALFSIIFGVYFLLDGKNLIAYWSRVLRAVSSVKFYKGFKIVVGDLDNSFSGYIRGQLADALFMMVAVGVSLSIVNVKFAIIIGVLTGVGNLIPYVGAFVAYISTILACLIDGDIKKLIIGVIVIFIVQTIDGNVVNPKLLSKSISIHPLLVIASLIIGSAIGGIGGMLLAVPIGAFLKTNFERFIDYLLRKRKTDAL